ncbi:MAG: type II toxin-antitoxin system VapC family toxin [Alphaproteobacteria bacterium]|nr:type II toxin-antitoxin system VapC family toxin [Alphaproteobacteria bacterium]
MIGIDTNVLVRFFVKDDVAQLEAARQCLRTECTPQSPGFVNRVVLCEFVWVLTRVYRIERAQVAGVLDKILHADSLTVEDEDLVEIALERYRHSDTDFADCVIALTNERRGCDLTRTFDHKAVAALAQFGLVPVGA